jgi:anti-sigma-K factor RskA
MKCSEFHELAAAYALDALSEEERLACVHHLASEGPHDGCEPLLERFERTVLALGESVPTVPIDHQVWHAIEARLGVEAKAVHLPVVSGRAPSSRSRVRELAAWAVAAAALIAALFSAQTQRSELAQRVAAERTLTSTREQLGRRVEQSERARAECSAALAALEQRGKLPPLALSLLEDPATKIAPMEQAGERPLRATALYNEASRRALVVSSTLEPVEGKDYELWVIAQGEPPRPAGFMRFDASGVAFGEFDPALLRDKDLAALAVSLEPAGGRPTPTEVVLLAKLQG